MGEATGQLLGSFSDQTPYEEMALRPGEPSPEEFFAERGYELRVREEGGRSVADLFRPKRWWRRSRLTATAYGGGKDDERAKLSAMRRWQIEQGDH